MQPAEPIPYARFVCGVIVPAGAGTAWASKGLIVMVGTEAGIVVEARYKFIRKFFGIAIDSDNFSKYMPRTFAAVWTASWDEISQLEQGPRSLVIRVRDRRGCWLAARPGRMMPLIYLTGLGPSPTSHVRTPPEQDLTQQVKFGKPSFLAAAKGISIRRVRTTIGRYV
jgi:hypothetical protein